MGLTVRIKAMKFTVSDGLRSRPLYIGSLPAGQLSDLSAVPSYTDTTPQATIARNILRPPIQDWQRPIVGARAQAIARRFSEAGEFMPNPVLLAVHTRSNVEVRPQELNGQLTEVYEIVVRRADGEEPPLWILDGQHRVRGLAGSTRNDNPVPLVLLHSDVASDYQAEDFARIFAEVTTEAEPLAGLHRDWLQFAFKLGPYDRGTPGSEAVRKAMQTVGQLCEEQTLGEEREPNPFFNKIQFNPKLAPTPVHGNGFAYNASNLKDLINSNYFGLPTPPAGFLTPERLALEMAKAMNTLIRVVTTPTDRSAFFGEGSYLHKPMEDAFVIGVLSALRMQRSPDWSALLQALGFNTTDWDFSSWVVTRGGTEGNTSRRVAERVFREIFETGTLPSGVSDVATFMSGDEAKLELVASHLTPQGRPQTADKHRQKYPINGRKPFSTSGRRHIKVDAASISPNIGKLEIVDIERPLDRDITFQKVRRGVILEERAETEWEFRADFYGGRSGGIKIVVKV
jgi:hypothetical protein